MTITLIKPANRAIESLLANYGSSLRYLFPQQKSLMAAVILTHLAAVDSMQSSNDTLKGIDPDHLLSGELRTLIAQIIDSSTPDELNHLAGAIVALHGADVAAGAYGK